MTESYDEMTRDLIVMLRGGVPEKCDFCGQPFTLTRHAVPEEGGEWACTECEARWSMADKTP